MHSFSSHSHIWRSSMNFCTLSSSDLNHQVTTTCSCSEQQISHILNARWMLQQGLIKKILLISKLASKQSIIIVVQWAHIINPPQLSFKYQLLPWQLRYSTSIWFNLHNLESWNYLYIFMLLCIPTFKFKRKLPHFISSFMLAKESTSSLILTRTLEQGHVNKKWVWHTIALISLSFGDHNHYNGNAPLYIFDIPSFLWAYPFFYFLIAFTQ